MEILPVTETGTVWQNELHYHSRDGLKLFARDTASDTIGQEAQDLPLLCLHGLTRNSLDFEPLAEMLPQYRIIAPDQRGRGRSDYDPNPAHYDIKYYIADMFRLIDHMKLNNIILVGTSMGGLMAMVMAAMKPHLFRGIVLNDVGPEIDPAGLERIKQYVGKGRPVGSWEEAAKRVRQINALAFPDYTQEDWMKFARRSYKLDTNGRPIPAYDNAIALPFAAPTSKLHVLKARVLAFLKRLVFGDLWRLFGRLGNIPILSIRGELSDILSAETQQKMAARHPQFFPVTIPNRGHAPMLDEPEAITALEEFVAKLQHD